MSHHGIGTLSGREVRNSADLFFSWLLLLHEGLGSLSEGPLPPSCACCHRCLHTWPQKRDDSMRKCCTLKPKLKPTFSWDTSDSLSTLDHVRMRTYHQMWLQHIFFWVLQKSTAAHSTDVMFYKALLLLPKSLIPWNQFQQQKTLSQIYVHFEIEMVTHNAKLS